MVFLLLHDYDISYLFFAFNYVHGKIKKVIYQKLIKKFETNYMTYKYLFNKMNVYMNIN